MVIPMVVEKVGHTERAYDIYSRLLRDRIIFLGSVVDDNIANSIVAQLLLLQTEDAQKPIHMYINSPGGAVTAGLAIFDTMCYVKPPVATYCMGQACSMGAILLTAGARGKRYALPNSRIMIHQPHGGVQGQATDIEIQAREILKMKELGIDIIAQTTGQSREKVAYDMERDFYMSAKEAKEYGLVDEVIG